MSDRLGPLQGTILLPNQVQCTPIFNTSVYEPVSNNINRSILYRENRPLFVLCYLCSFPWQNMYIAKYFGSSSDSELKALKE